MARSMFPFSVLLLLSLLVEAASAECSSPVQVGSCEQFFTDEALQLDKQWEESFPECCAQLEGITVQCRCQAITQVVTENVQVQQLKEGSPLKLQILNIAQELPVICGISDAQSCENIQLQQQQQQQQQEHPSVI